MVAGFKPGDVGHLAEHDRIKGELAGRLSDAQLSATFAKVNPGAVLANLYQQYPNGIVTAHRCGAATLPEDTILAGRACIAGGVPMLNFNCTPLADGTIGMIHDPTIDRTMTGTGNVIDHTAMSWSQLVIDPATVIGGTWANIVGPPTLPEVLNEFGGHVALIFEIMDNKVAQPTVDEIVARGLQATVIIASRNLADLTAAIAAGIETYIVDDTGVGSPASYVAAGVTGVGVKCQTDASSAGTVTQATIDAYRAAGLRIELHTTSRVFAVQQYTGINLIASDSPVYMQRALYGDPIKRPTQKANPYKQAVFPPGHVVNYGAQTNAKLAGGKCRWSGNSSLMALVGDLCPVDAKAGTYTITFTVTWATIDSDSSSYVRFFLAAPTDAPFINGTVRDWDHGYLLLLRQAGTWEFDTFVGATGSTVRVYSGADARPAVTVAGTTETVTVAVTPTDITVTFSGGTTKTIVDSVNRGGFIHQGAFPKTAGVYDITVAVS